MPTTPLALLGFGFLLGVRHALDVDHLAAVSTIVSARRGAWGSSLVGALWGLGHTAALLGVALTVVALHAEIPPRLALGLELGVAAMLIGLGVNLLWTLRRGGRVHHHAHAHGGRLHVHPHVHGVEAVDDGHHRAASVRRPFLVGLVHGLAGSAGLMLAVVATIPSSVLALAYVVVFGVGSIGGMTAVSALLGAPLALVTARFARAETALRACAAVGSVVIGILVAWKIGVQARTLL
jgi:hypothetical protein